jgi:2-iminobutanoate/2-iminopropanoate deaminase
MKRLAFLWVAAVLAVAPVFAQQTASHVFPLNPSDSIKATGPWGLVTRAGDTLYVAGMRGIDPKTAFLNMKHIVESQLEDCVRIVVYTTDMYRYRPIANKVQEELWGKGPYPPRTIIEVHRLNQDDILEVEGTFYIASKK